MGRNLWIKQLRKEDGDLLTDEEFDPLSAKEGWDHHAPREPRIINIGGKATIWMGKGDRLVIETPGGGAWGAADEDEAEKENKAGDVLGGVGKAVSEKVQGLTEWAARGSLAERAAAQAAFGGF
jgi:5-oxoprolinase (ATP-hydrolysing)